MQSSYLIQRLKKPFKATDNEKAKLLQNFGDAFAFGGGLVNGGLKEEAMKLLRPIFRFDYMGSAEFEFGAVPETLAKILDGVIAKEYGHFRIPVQFSYKNWKEKKPKTGIADVYVICKISDELEIISRINTFAKETYHNTKEVINLNSSLAQEEYSKDIVGWLELDNAFMFFSDKEMYDKVVALLFGDEKDAKPV